MTMAGGGSVIAVTVLRKKEVVTTRMGLRLLGAEGVQGERK